MKNRFIYLVSLSSGLVIIAVSLYGFSLLCRRPGVPATIPLDSLVRIDGIELRSAHHLNYALSLKKIGDSSEFTLRTPGGEFRPTTARLVSYYGRSVYPLICLFAGLMAAGLGFLAFILKPQDEKARLFFWLTLAFCAALVINSEEYVIQPGRWATFFPSVGFILSYALAPALLLHFSLSFEPPRFRLRRGLIYAPGVMFAFTQAALVLTAHLAPSIRALNLYSGSYLIFRAYMAVFLTVSVAHLFRAYRRAQEEEPRSQIKWIFFGMAAGLSPFVFLYHLPRALGLSSGLREEITNLFFLILPVAMAIAIIRYRLVDISRVINRSLVYSLLTVFTVGVYLAVVQLAQRLFARLSTASPTAFSAAGAFLAALAFQPAQRRIQDLVDRAFFRQRYDYRRLVYEFAERARHFVSAPALIEYFLKEVRRVLPAERLGLDVRLRRSAGGGEEDRLPAGDALDIEIRPGPASRKGIKVWARPSAVQAADLVDAAVEEALERAGLDLVLDLPLAAGTGRGRLGLGRLKSGRRFSREDIELLRTLAGELCVHLQRIRLQEEVIFERASREKLDELNRLKTEFISSVSHELRTPMSSIRGLAEVLQAGKVRTREQREKYLDLMVSESGRLSRFIHNVLDFGRIERGAMTYDFQPADLRGIVEEAAEALRGCLEKQGFSLALRLPSLPVTLTVDTDAVKQAVINLLDNAMKYSPEAREVEVELREAESVEVRVQDRGIGISEEDREKIFGPFYRIESAARRIPGGAGLGLKIVRHIMEAHGGEVRVESQMGAGSTFSLVFPKP